MNKQAHVTCAMFRGATKTYIIDRKDFAGDLYSIYEEVMVYLQAKLNTALIPHARGWDERLELPEDVLREARDNFKVSLGFFLVINHISKNIFPSYCLYIPFCQYN